MPITIEWPEITLRLALTVVAGTLIGLNRCEHGHSAGLRTTLLVCLAASVSMIQVNLLLPIAGKTPGSFAVLGLMRLPLGGLADGAGEPKATGRGRKHKKACPKAGRGRIARTLWVKNHGQKPGLSAHHLRQPKGQAICVLLGRRINHTPSICTTRDFSPPFRRGCI
jgi:MgtC family